MSTGYEEQTVEELRDELRDRDLPVSGPKDSLVERLQADDVDGDEDGGASGAAAGGSLQGVLARLGRELSEVAGLNVERTFGLIRDDQGWRAKVEVVEVSRVPPSTDILGSYEVVTDGDGAVLSFERIERYRRSEASA